MSSPPRDTIRHLDPGIFGQDHHVFGCCTARSARYIAGSPNARAAGTIILLLGKAEVIQLNARAQSGLVQIRTKAKHVFTLLVSFVLHDRSTDGNPLHHETFATPSFVLFR